MALDKDAILGLGDAVVKLITVPHWGDVYIHVLTGEERDVQESIYADIDAKDYPWRRARYVAYALCDEFGNRLFTDDDIPELAKKNGVAINYIFEQAAALNGATEEAAIALGKGLDDTPLDAPGSD